MKKMMLLSLVIALSLPALAKRIAPNWRNGVVYDLSEGIADSTRARAFANWLAAYGPEATWTSNFLEHFGVDRGALLTEMNQNVTPEGLSNLLICCQNYPFTSPTFKLKLTSFVSRVTPHVREVMQKHNEAGRHIWGEVTAEQGYFKLVASNPGTEKLNLTIRAYQSQVWKSKTKKIIGRKNTGKSPMNNTVAAGKLQMKPLQKNTMQIVFVPSDLNLYVTAEHMESIKYFIRLQSAPPADASIKLPENF